MPVARADGPLGLEAQHQFGDSAGRTTLNGPNFVWPRLHLDKITGLHSLPENEDKREVQVSHLGEHIYPAIFRGKTIVYEGRVIGRSLQEMRSYGTAFRYTMARFHSTEGQMLIVPDPAYGTQQFSYKARVLSLDMDEEQTRGPHTMPYPYQRDFTLGIRMSDPRFYAWPTVVDQSGDTGVAVTNLGTAPTDPIITLTGLSSRTGVKVGSTTAGKDLVFRTLPGTTDVTIDFLQRNITQFGFGDITGYLNVGSSEWWDQGVQAIRPGLNNLTVTNADMRITFYHAFY